SGIVDNTGGTLSAPSASFVGCRARAYVSGGGHTTIGATSYCSIGLTSSTTLFSTTGTGSVLDLSSVTSINAGFDDGSTGQTVHTISASSGGTIDLRGLTDLTSPLRFQDHLEFDLAGGSINLSSLATIPSAAGWTFFDVHAGSALSLPSLTSASDTQFYADG